MENHHYHHHNNIAEECVVEGYKQHKTDNAQYNTTVCHFCTCVFTTHFFYNNTIIYILQYLSRVDLEILFQVFASTHCQCGQNKNMVHPVAYSITSMIGSGVDLFFGRSVAVLNRIIKIAHNKIPKSTARGVVEEDGQKTEWSARDREMSSLLDVMKRDMLQMSEKLKYWNIQPRHQQTSPRYPNAPYQHEGMLVGGMDGENGVDGDAGGRASDFTIFKRDYEYIRDWFVDNLILWSTLEYTLNRQRINRINILIDKMHPVNRWTQDDNTNECIGVVKTHPIHPMPILGVSARHEQCMDNDTSVDGGKNTDEINKYKTSLLTIILNQVEAMKMYFQREIQFPDDDNNGDDIEHYYNNSSTHSENDTECDRMDCETIISNKTPSHHYRNAILLSTSWNVFIHKHQFFIPLKRFPFQQRHYVTHRTVGDEIQTAVVKNNNDNNNKKPKPQTFNVVYIISPKKEKKKKKSVEDRALSQSTFSRSDPHDHILQLKDVECSGKSVSDTIFILKPQVWCAAVWQNHKCRIWPKKNMPLEIDIGAPPNGTSDRIVHNTVEYQQYPESYIMHKMYTQQGISLYTNVQDVIKIRNMDQIVTSDVEGDSDVLYTDFQHLFQHNTNHHDDDNGDNDSGDNPSLRDDNRIQNSSKTMSLVSTFDQNVNVTRVYSNNMTRVCLPLDQSRVWCYHSSQPPSSPPRYYIGEKMRQKFCLHLDAVDTFQDRIEWHLIYHRAKHRFCENSASPRGHNIINYPDTLHFDVDHRNRCAHFIQDRYRVLTVPQQQGYGVHTNTTTGAIVRSIYTPLISITGSHRLPIMCVLFPREMTDMFGWENYHLMWLNFISKLSSLFGSEFAKAQSRPMRGEDDDDDDPLYHQHQDWNFTHHHHHHRIPQIEYDTLRQHRHNSNTHVPLHPAFVPRHEYLKQCLTMIKFLIEQHDHYNACKTLENWMKSDFLSQHGGSDRAFCFIEWMRKETMSLKLHTHHTLQCTIVTPSSPNEEEEEYETDSWTIYNHLVYEKLDHLAQIAHRVHTVIASVPQCVDSEFDKHHPTRDHNRQKREFKDDGDGDDVVRQFYTMLEKHPIQMYSGKPLYPIIFHKQHYHRCRVVDDDDVVDNGQNKKHHNSNTTHITIGENNRLSALNTIHTYKDTKYSASEMIDCNALNPKMKISFIACYFDTDDLKQIPHEITEIRKAHIPFCAFH